MTKHAHRLEEATFHATPFTTLALTNGPAFDAFTRVGEACTKACVAWQEEVMRFAGDRLKKDSELGQSMTACQNWADLAKVQQEWAAATARDYAEEAARLTQLATKLTRDGIAAWSAKPDATH